MKLKVCTICSIEYEARGQRFGTSKYCSAKCFGLGSRKQEERTCRNCRTIFMFKPSQLNKYPNGGRYCSRKCGYEYRVKKTALKPIKDKYGRSKRKADKDWQLAVRERDNYTCQKCGIKQPYIHTHHKATRSTRPDLKHMVSNGICLCNSCHTWVHKNPTLSYKLGFLLKSGSN